MNCIIIDDEPMARSGLKEYIGEVDFLKLLGEFEHPLKAMDIIGEQSIDLIFLDIQMPKITGTDFLKSLQHPPLIIFTTAFPDYALQGYELNAVDYLLKPFSFDRFLKAVMKAKTLLSKTGQMEYIENSDEYFFIKSDNAIVKIKLDEILFAEALQNYIAIHTTQKKYVSYLTFKAVLDKLLPHQFIQTHKSFVVSPTKVDSVSGNEMKIGSHIVPISRNLKDEVMEKLLKGKFLKR
jgi:DNA-binding LytR/AlgR family response regulator